MDVGGATTEDLRVAPAGGDHQHEQDQAEECRRLAQRRIAEQVIDEPTDDQRTEADGYCGGGGEVAAWQDQVEAGVEVVDHHQQGNARQPGGIGLPFEPVQVLRHLRRGQLVFFKVVDAAAVNRPEIAGQAFSGAGAVEVIFQPDEVERGTDPGDAVYNVNPATTQFQPFGVMCVHDYLPLARPANRPLFLVIRLVASGQCGAHSESRWGSRNSSSSLKKCSSQLLPEPLRS